MDFAEAMAAVRAGNATEDHISAVEKHYNDASSAANGHKSRAETLAQKAAKAEKYERSLSAQGFDLAGDLDSQFSTFKTKAAPSQNDEMSRQLASVTAELKEIREEKKRTADELAQETAKNHFGQTFNDSKFIGGDMFLSALMLQGKIGVDEKRKPFVKIGDEFLPGDEANIEKLIEAHPSIKKARANQQSAGGGSSGASGGTKNKMDESSFNKLGAKEKAAFMAGGGTII